MDVIAYALMRLVLEVIAPDSWRTGWQSGPSKLPHLDARWGTPTHDPDGLLVLRYSSWTRGCILVVVNAVAVGLAIAVLWNPPELPGAVGVAGLYAIILALVWDCLRFRLLVSPEGLDCRSPWRGRHFVTWDDVEQLSYNVRDQSFTIYSLAGYRFRVPTWGMALAGIDLFLEQCEQHLPLETLWPARDGYTALGRESPARVEIESK
jgi:hypothetical protein